MERGICKMHVHLLRLQRSRQMTLLSNTLLLVCLFFLILPSASHAQCSSTLGCFPPLGNLATGRTVQTDSECSSGDQYCIYNTADCSNTCDSSLNSIASINDGNNGTAWISAIGPNSTEVTLQLDFESPVMFDSMSMLWESVRPQSMVLERSSDGGTTWLAYRFYSASCQTTFAEMPVATFPGVEFTSTDAICTGSESSINPTPNGEVTFYTSQHLPEGTSSEESANYRRVTNLRVRLLAQFTQDLEPGFQYYSVDEWVVRGSCMCNGHADMCAPVPGEEMATDKVYSGCMCEHNTEGTHCDRCQIGYNAVQWNAGTPTDDNACERCMCNGHAPDCTSENLEEGVQCIDCVDNTEGNNCQQCRAGYYQDVSALLNDPNICIDCACEAAGTTGSDECSAAGQCSCKSNVTGLQCSQCVDGHWNLTADNEQGCQECVCDPRGTQQSSTTPSLPLCDQATGLCQCLDNIGGDMCDTCDDGYYSLEDGCLPCGCNLAASTSAACDKTSPDGQCSCLPNVDTTTCTAPLPGFYFRYLDHELYEAEEAALSEGVTPVYPGPDSSVEYSGRGLVIFPSSATVTFSVQVPRDYAYEIILRLQSPANVDSVNVFIESQSPVTQDLGCFASANTTTVSTFLGPHMLASAEGYHVVGTVCMVAGAVYRVDVQYSEFSAASEGWMLDSLLLLPGYSSSSAYYARQLASGQSDLVELCLPRSVASGGQREECRDVAFALSVEFYGEVFECDCSSSVGADASVTCATFGGQCLCLGGVTGLLCDVCRNGWFNYSDTGCQACDCDMVGSRSTVCDQDSGQCDCQPDIVGQRCDACISGYFNLSSTGCSDCSCSAFSTSVQCSESGQCPCVSGVGGATCVQCLPEYYNISTSGCTACNCSSVGVRSSSNDCDSVSGQCLCIGSTVSRDCSECPVGFFETDGSDTDACVECVCSGRSDSCSGDTDGYQLAAVQSQFTQLCAQNPVACDDGWQLITASGQIAAPYGPSDATGLGYILLNNDNPMLYAPDKFLGNQQASYGLWFTVSVSLSSTVGLKTTTSITLASPLLAEPLVGVFPAPMLEANGVFLNTIVTYAIPLVEGYWRVGSSTGPSATFFQLYSTLTNLTQLSFSAEYRQDFIEFVYVQSVWLQTRVPLATQSSADLTLLTTPYPVEQCTCPAEYVGRTCEQCARGHARPSRDPADPCVECNCNNLSLDCDVDTAICIDCTGNSEGDNCERCQPGYYGDPTRGIPCLPCQCPTQEISFSSTCFLDSDLNATCDNCDPGYTGRSCESCADGYFGNPLIGQCTTCECNMNVDPALGPVCDTDIGRCLNCLNNTQGFECDTCLPGYYGDPPSGVPCRPCGCHPNGTIGDCNSIFGTCTCAGENVLGENCDECRDGYWGLSQGLPCVACDCCSNGSDSSICNKETGRCDCHSNVGSEEDDKCCTCTPGYFNFTPQGCQACDCSELSLSEECDIVSGQCQCQEGAMGLKCNDCAFGFFGTVPDCQQCHACFSQWYDRIQELKSEVDILENRARLLVILNYNGYTVESIEADVQGLLDQLAAANATLQSITLEGSSVQQLQDSLSETSETIAEMDELTMDIEQQLTRAEQMLATTAAFDGTVDETSVNELVQQIAFYNNTIASLAMSADQLLSELMTDHTLAIDTWAAIEALDSNVQTLLAESSLAETTVDRAEALVNQFEAEKESLRGNLTRLSVAADDLLAQLAGLSVLAGNASRDSSAAYASVQSLRTDLAALRSEADRALSQAQQLNSSIQTTRTASQQLAQSTDSLVEFLTAIQQTAQELSGDVISGLNQLEALVEYLQATKTIAEETLALNSSLPSLDYVQELAGSISTSILSDEQVQGIVANATTSREAAQRAMDLVHNASDAVAATQTLIEELISDLTATEATQERVEETLPRLRESIDNFTQELDQARAGAVSVNGTAQEVADTVEAAGSVVDSATQTAIELQSRSRQLRDQASADAGLSQEYANDVDGILTRFADLQEGAEISRSQSEQDRQEADRLLADAQQLYTDTNAVSLQQLQDLLQDYTDEAEAVARLREQASELEDDLRTLTSSFTEAAQRLSQCYQTP